MSALLSTEVDKIKCLYFIDKLSAPEIAKKYNVSVGAVYYVLRRNLLKRREPSEQNRIRFEKKAPSFRLRNRLNNSELSLKTSGVMLYWAEGFQSEKAGIVDFANSKPAMIGIFLNFLRKICGVKELKLRAYLYCYSNQNVDKLIDFWSGITDIPKSQFTKPYIRRDYDANKIGKMKYGLLHIRYGDKKLLRIIRTWIGEYTSELCGGGRVDNYSSL